MTNKSRSPKRSLRAFGLALVAVLAFAGLAASSASALSINPSSGKGAVNSQSLVWQASGEPASECRSKSSGSYRVTSSTGGVFEEVKLRECGNSFYKCTTAGQPTGTIALSNLNFTLVYLDALKTKFGYKLTPASGTVAEFTCGNGWSYKWTGSVLGRITEPPLNTVTNNAKLSFAASSSNQEYQQIEGAGTAYHISQSRNGEPTVSVGISSLFNLEGTTTFSYQP